MLLNSQSELRRRSLENSRGILCATETQQIAPLAQEKLANAHRAALVSSAALLEQQRVLTTRTSHDPEVSSMPAESDEWPRRMTSEGAIFATWSTLGTTSPSL